MFILDLSTAVPFPQPGFCRLAKFWKASKEISSYYYDINMQKIKWETELSNAPSNTSLFIASIFTFTLRAIFPTSSTSFSIRFLIAGTSTICYNGKVGRIISCHRRHKPKFSNMLQTPHKKKKKKKSLDVALVHLNIFECMEMGI